MTEALCTLLGAVIGAIISFLTVKRTIYNETVSQRRNVWLNEMREYISQMLAYKKVIVACKNNSACIKPENCEIHNNGNDAIDAEGQTSGCNESITHRRCYIEFVEKYETAKNQVLIRLNLSEQKHQLLKSTIEDLDNDSKNYNDVAPIIIEISRSILKDEWEKVKKETKGGK